MNIVLPKINENTTPKEAMDAVKFLSDLSKSGFTYNWCKEQSKPYLKIVNKRAVEIGEQYGIKPKLISFTHVAR